MPGPRDLGEPPNGPPGVSSRVRLSILYFCKDGSGYRVAGEVLKSIARGGKD
jgi:hypothetical protein